MLTKIPETIKKNLYLIFLIILIFFFSFQLGRVSKTASQPIKIQNAAIQEIFSSQNNADTRSDANDANKDRGVEKIDFRAKSIQELDRSPDSIEFRVVASKNGSKYHFLWCSGAKQIKEENKIYFNSEEEAVAAGYTLAANCSK